jgi:hypothetical protein
MARIARFAITLAGACLIAFAAGIALTRLHADTGWYYGVGITLTAIVGLRTLVPDSGISIGGRPHRGPHRRARHKHLPTAG